MRCTGRWYQWLAVIVICILFLSGCGKDEDVTVVYETENYNKDIYRGSLFAEDLCVVSQDVSMEGAPDTSGLHALALFDLNGRKTDCAYKVHERLFPASTTKIMTALLALKYGELSDMITVSANASSTSFAADESICGIKTGDQLTLLDLLRGLMMESGNDAAVAIAEYIAGSSEAFAQMMNDEARNLMATHTHFMNSNGLHDENHYTTAYDLYLIFQACIQYEEFVDIISTKQYTVEIKGADGQTRRDNWEQTNFYATGEAALPQNALIVGGKTGTTKKAGNCLILLEKDSKDDPYISIVMGAGSKELLYQNMTALINGIPVSE